MEKMAFFYRWLVVGFICFAFQLRLAASGETVASPGLVWDAKSKEYQAKPEDVEAMFTFSVKNESGSAVEITAIRTSCGCTVAKLEPLPEKPYLLAANASVPIAVTLDLRGKQGKVTKEVTVESSRGTTSLLVSATVPESGITTQEAQIVASGLDGPRAENMRTAIADRHAIFRGECASCHVAPGVGKRGAELYAAVCGICHESPHRASLVPDLKGSSTTRSVSYWYKWIVEGKAGGMMPPFSQHLGGPLSNEQVDSLITFLVVNFSEKSKRPTAQP